MSGGMCKNCIFWDSTDQTWGECSQIIADYPNGAQKRASINCYRSDAEDFEEIGLWSAHDFGCREWKSLHASLKNIANLERTKVSSSPRNPIEQEINPSHTKDEK